MREMRSPVFLTSLSSLLITKPHVFCVSQRFFHYCWRTHCSEVPLCWFFLQNSLCSKHNLTKVLRRTVKGPESNFCHFRLRKYKRYVPAGWVPDSRLSQHQVFFPLVTAQGMYLGQVKICKAEGPGH